MRAAVLERARQAITIRNDIEIIEPRVGEVRVSVRYCGLCHSDLSFLNGTMPMMGPMIPGHEASGIVECLIASNYCGVAALADWRSM